MVSVVERSIALAALVGAAIGRPGQVVHGGIGDDEILRFAFLDEYLGHQTPARCRPSSGPVRKSVTSRPSGGFDNGLLA
ncbi:MAG: hypothetical protein R2864_08305 [Syntrophotaleaceae bacterium]